MNPISLKLVIAGDSKVQKATILYNYYQGIVNNYQQIDYQPNIFDNCRITLNIEEKKISLSLWDTSGQEQYELLRKLAYIKANIVLIVFLIDQKETYTNAVNKWYPQVLQNTRGAIISFVGVKSKQGKLSNKSNSLHQYIKLRERLFQDTSMKNHIYLEQNDSKIIGLAVQQSIKQLFNKLKVSNERFQCQACQII